MADEIAITLAVSVTNGNFLDNINMGTLQFNQSNEGVDGSVVEIATSETTISLSDLTTEGYMLLRNLDTTNYIDIGPDSTGQVDFIRLLAGEVALFPLTPGPTVKATANTAACNLFVRAWED